MIDTADLKKVISANIKRIRTTNNITQTEIANKIGISYAAYSRIENGLHMPSLEVAYAISQIFKVSVDSLREFPVKQSEKKPQKNMNKSA